jgi:serine/threonine-protein kinase
MNEALVGTTLDGRYRIVRELGRGGMGAVYEAHHTGIDRRLAVKVLHAEMAGEPSVLERFRREARITGSLGHPNIIQVTDTGTTPGGAPYLVMELLEGRSLSSVLRNSPRLSVRQALDIIMPVLRALSTVHANGIIHRDIKPENIFLAEGLGADGARETVIKVLDFGISKPVDTKLQGSTLTATGAIVGTPYYMSPEQVRSKDFDHRADLYACGVILYQILTGRAPFDADNFGDLFVAILNQDPVEMRALRPELPEALEAVVHRAMARDKEERFASADELLRALKPFARRTSDANQGATATQEQLVTSPHYPLSETERGRRTDVPDGVPPFPLREGGTGGLGFERWGAVRGGFEEPRDGTSSGDEASKNHATAPASGGSASKDHAPAQHRARISVPATTSEHSLRASDGWTCQVNRPRTESDCCP